MDTSKEYIKMCDCPEIQKKWKPKDWKSYTVWHTRLKTVGDIIYGRDWEHSEGELIWFPHQDQIQEMMKGHYKLKDFELTEKRDEWIGILEEFFYFISDYDEQWRYVGKDTIHNTSSMEQLWLAFYMWEKHKKVWNGEKWVR